MRKLMWTVWCLVPLGASIYHFGPGQERLRLEQADAAVGTAAEHAARASELARTQGDEAAAVEWGRAVTAYSQALALLPDERVYERRQLTLERAQGRMLTGQLPEANGELGVLVDELEQDAQADPVQLAAARRSLASSDYYLTWLMRLEGLPRTDWEPRIEAARQLYKLLASEAAADAGPVNTGGANTDAAENAGALAEDLESAVRLARMDLDELQGLPLPSQ